MARLPGFAADLVPVAAALFASSVLCAILWVARPYDGILHPYFFMPWNLALAWLPLMLAVASRAMIGAASARAQMAGWALAALWLLFLPNAPYVLTDMLHLRRDMNVPLWFDPLLMGVFVTTGLGLGFASLLVMHDAFVRAMNASVAWMLVTCAIGAAAFGMYIGRVLRWNSWDALLAPRAVARDVMAIVLDPVTHADAWYATLAIAAFLWFGYATVVAARGVGRNGSGWRV